jgi:hypothetical protein
MKKLESIFFTTNAYLSRFLEKACERLYEIFYNLILMLIVGCAHLRMGRPITIGGITYRICPECGAYRLYDLKKMQFYGTYFYRFPVEGEAARSYSAAGSLLLGGQIKQAA